MHEDFPPGLKQFIENHIESVPQLESLLLLRNDPQRKWSAADVAKALYIPEDVASSLLTEFVRRGFATIVPPAARYEYRIRDSEADMLIDTLASVYRERRVAVISLIYSKPLNKVQTFADAFRFGKETPS
ncbi:MAG: hypothetical protein WD738_17215 [Pirellulales bacterium]